MKWFLLVNKHNNWYANTIYCDFKFCVHDKLSNEHYPNHVQWTLSWDVEGYENQGTYFVTSNYNTDDEGTYIVSGADNSYREYTKEVEQMFVNSIKKETISEWVKELFATETHEEKRTFIRIVLAYLATVKGGK